MSKYGLPNRNNHRASSGALFLYYLAKYYPITHIIIPLSSLHFPPFLPTFIHPPSQLWKCGKLCGKLAIFTYKYPMNQHKIPVNDSKYLEILLVYYLCFLFISFESVVPLIYWEPMVPTPSFARKDFVFSPRPLTSFGSPSNRFSFIEPDGSQMKKPTSSCSHFEKGFWKRENEEADRL